MDAGELMPLVLVLIPIIAISGGIIHGIVKTIGRQRLAELAQRERIVAIERGLDPSTLPPLLAPGHELCESGLTFEQRQRRSMQGLLIGGLVTTAVGLGLLIPFVMMNNQEGYVPGIVLSCIGVALLIGARIVRPTGNGNSHR